MTAARRWISARTWPRLAIAGLLFIVVLSFTYTWILTGVAEILVYNEGVPSVRHVLLWNRSPFASQAAAQRMRDSAVESVVNFDCPPSRLQRLGILPSDAVEARVDCAEAGIPDDLLQAVTSPSRDNVGKCTSLMGWLDAHPDEDLIVLCEAFRTRDLRWEINHRFSAAAARRVHVQPFWPRDVSVRRWWRSETAINGVIGGWVYLLHPVIAGRTDEDSQECNPEQFSPAQR